MQAYVETEVDISDLTPADCALFLRKNGLILFGLLKAAGKQLAKSGDEQKIAKLESTDVSFNFACYKKAKEAVNIESRPLPTDTLSALAMSSCEITVEDGKLATSVMLYDGAMPDFGVAPPYVDPQSIVINLGESRAVCQSVRGEVILSPEVATAVSGVLQTAIKEVEPMEVLIAARVADLYTYTKKGFSLKSISTNKAVILEDEAVLKLSEAGVILTKVFGQALRNLHIGTIKGRQLMGRVQALMEDFRISPQYKPTMSKLRSFLLTKIDLTIVKSLGDDVQGSIAYSYKFRDSMRAIRGEDKKDSTFVSTSIYFPYNMSRVYAKHAMRVHDLYSIGARLQVTKINIVGKAASSYVESLTLFGGKQFDAIGVQNIRVSGWECDNVRGISTREGIPFVLERINQTYWTVNVDLEVIDEPWLMTPEAYSIQDRVVQLVPIVSGALSSGRVLVSGLVHTLHGYLFPADAPKFKLKYTESTYFKAADEVNLYMTFYSLMKKNRSELSYHKLGVTVKPGVVQRLNKKLLDVNRIELETARYDDVELVMTQQEIKKFEAAAKEADTQASEEEEDGDELEGENENVADYDAQFSDDD